LQIAYLRGKKVGSLIKSKIDEESMIFISPALIPGSPAAFSSIFNRVELGFIFCNRFHEQLIKELGVHRTGNDPAA